MNLWKRVILTSILIILFFIVSPLVLLYSTGYRFDFEQRTFIKTGLISIKTAPGTASVYVNDVLHGNKTPTKISHLFPDIYTVRVEKEGYNSWEKNLEVRSHEATLAEDIILYKKDSPFVPIVNNTSITSGAFSGQHFVYAEKRADLYALSSINLDSQSITTIATSPVEMTFRLSPSKTMLAFQTSQDIQISDLTGETLLSLGTLFQKSTANLVLDALAWHQTNTDLVYVQFEGLLYEVSLSQQKATPIHELGAKRFIVHEGKAIFISQGRLNSFITSIDLDSPEIPALTIAKLPLTQNYEFTQFENRLISLLDKQNNLLFLIDLDQDTITPIIDSIFDVKHASWATDQRTLFYFNDFELWTWDRNTEQSQLINRFSTPIIDAHLLESSDVLFAFDNTIHVLEQDKRSSQNIISLATIEHVDQLFLSDDEKTVFVYGGKDGTSGLYRFELQ